MKLYEIIAKYAIQVKTHSRTTASGKISTVQTYARKGDKKVKSANPRTDTRSVIGQSDVNKPDQVGSRTAKDDTGITTIGKVEGELTGIKKDVDELLKKVEESEVMKKFKEHNKVSSWRPKKDYGMPTTPDKARVLDKDYKNGIKRIKVIVKTMGVDQAKKDPEYQRIKKLNQWRQREWFRLTKEYQVKHKIGKFGDPESPYAVKAGDIPEPYPHPFGEDEKKKPKPKSKKKTTPKPKPKMVQQYKNLYGFEKLQNKDIQKALRKLAELSPEIERIADLPNDHPDQEKLEKIDEEFDKARNYIKEHIVVDTEKIKKSINRKIKMLSNKWYRNVKYAHNILLDSPHLYPKNTTYSILKLGEETITNNIVKMQNDIYNQMMALEAVEDEMYGNYGVLGQSNTTADERYNYLMETLATANKLNTEFNNRYATAESVLKNTEREIKNIIEDKWASSGSENLQLEGFKGDDVKMAILSVMEAIGEYEKNSVSVLRGDRRLYVTEGPLYKDPTAKKMFGDGLDKITNGWYDSLYGSISIQSMRGTSENALWNVAHEVAHALHYERIGINSDEGKKIDKMYDEMVAGKYGTKPLRIYGYKNSREFFAVGVEEYFVNHKRLKFKFPEMVKLVESLGISKFRGLKS